MAKRKRSRLVPSPFFVLRTPLLPFEELERLGEGMGLAAAIAGGDEKGDQKVLDAAALAEAAGADRRLLLMRLGELIERAELFEALFVASPSLLRGYETWRAKPESKKGRRFERALIRYVLRMTTRATPFGLFAGCSTGGLGESSHLELPGRDAYRRHTRLDMDYLFALCESLAGDDEVRDALRYRPSSSLYRAGSRLRYAEARLAGKNRSYHLVAVDESQALDSVLTRAADGARLEELAAGLVADLARDGEEVTPEEARDYVEELVEAQILVSDLSPPVTGVEPIHDLVPRLEKLAPARPAAAGLDRARGALEELDAAGLGSPPERYREIARGLESLPTRADLPRLFQVDMFKPAPSLTLGRDVLGEITGGIDLLHLMSDRNRLPDELHEFRQEFLKRYGEGREVPLVEALDEELGIGIEGTGAAGEVSPLLEGLGLSPRSKPPKAPWTRREVFLLRKIQEATARGEHELVLGRGDVEALTMPEENRPPLPDAVEVMAQVAADSPEALAEGKFSVLLKGATGPSGVRLAGRFCHADEAMARGVRHHLDAEESLDPDAVFAEIAHLPAGRSGNVLCRPVLRDYEIPYLGRSGAPRERQLPITDLWVTVTGGRVVLRSASLGRRILPRLTSAHNYARKSLGIYRFLGAMQGQGVASGLAWSWGPLEKAAFRPRVRRGRLVLARAGWRLHQLELEKLQKKTPEARFEAAQEWRRRRRLPRRVALIDGDQELLLDFDQLFSVEAWLDAVKERTVVELTELYPDPDQLVVRGPEGRFVHEMLVSFVRDGGARSGEDAAEQASGEQASGTEAEAGTDNAATETPDAPAVRRRFPPGSPWLYACLFTGSATADKVLAEVVAPVVRRALRSGAADRWFFIRYGDPDWHLRLRLRGEPARLLAEVLPHLEAASRPLLDDGRMWRLGLDTYDRELERYGGAAGMELCEEVFCHDSEAVLALVRMLDGVEDPSLRWHLALRGLDDLFEDFGFDLEGRLRVARRLAAGYRGEFAESKELRLALSRRYRDEREGLEDLLDRDKDGESELWPGLAALRHRSKRLAGAAAGLRRLAAEGRLEGGFGSTLEDLLGSFTHMYVNRLIRSGQRAHEVVLYDLLARLYESQEARARSSRG